METSQRIAMLYEKDTSATHRNLLELEKLSDAKNSLYCYFDQFISMLDSEIYGVRVRGFRLMCKQAKWDKENKINGSIEKILLSLDDEKPSAVAMFLQSLGHSLLPYKKELGEKIRQVIIFLDCSRFRADTMRPLIKREINKLTKQIDAQ